MAYLLDTCTLSELVAQRPLPSVVDALLALPRDELHLSVITLGELQSGIEQLPSSARKNHLALWFTQQVIPFYQDRTIPLDTTIALRWGVLCAQLRQRGKTMQTTDSLIAATALAHNMTVVTRDETDFAAAGVPILNPWS